jgi:WD40 repeat protein
LPDWTVKVWSQRTAAAAGAALSLQSGFDAVTDVCWSPVHATVFASCTREGAIEVWDLQHSTLDPLIRFAFPATAATRHQLSRMQFARNAPALLTGSADGTVEVFRVYGVDTDAYAADAAASSSEAASSAPAASAPTRAEQAALLARIVAAEQQGAAKTSTATGH